MFKMTKIKWLLIPLYPIWLWLYLADIDLDS